MSPSWPHIGHKRPKGGSTHYSADPAECYLCVVTAHTPDGFVAATPMWPALLDGVLAWVDRRIMRGVKPGQSDRHVESMPLFRVGSSKRFVWAASAAHIPDSPVEHRPWGRRADTEYHNALGKPRRINVSTGRDKSLWQTDPVTVCGTPEWRCIGHPDTLTEWLGHVTHIGAAARRGQGRVTKWEVTPIGLLAGRGTDEITQQVSWVMHRDGEMARPVHPRLGLGTLGHTGRTVPGAYRPPYLHPTETSIGRRHMIPVLAKS